MVAHALRGMALVAAATLVVELGDITRFANPRQLMAYLGLVPYEHSSAGTRRQGGITKVGNSAALIEAAWSYRFPARISREQLLRQEGLAKPIRDTAWKARNELCRRYRKLARAKEVASHQHIQSWARLEARHGQENPRFHYQPDLIRRWPLDRGISATHHRSGGNQPPDHLHPVMWQCAGQPGVMGANGELREHHPGSVNAAAS
jgi:hypothetical protein